MRVAILLLAILALSAFVGCQAKPMVVSESQPGLEGIKVHGDWTVEVTNPDGSLATRKQFSNHITNSGLGVLAALMTYDETIVDRRINFLFVPISKDNYADGDFFCNDAESMDGDFYYPRDPEAVSVLSADQKGSIWSAGCTVSLMPNAPGDVTSTKISTISGRVTFTGSQSPMSLVTFSQQHLLPGIEVVVGQYISATVVYSFK